MKHLKAPWRWKFLSGPARSDGACILCEAQDCEQNESLICYTGERAYVILNKYPYNNGHLMVVPKAHVTTPLDADPEVMQEVWSLMTESLRVLRKVFNPDGFNVGMNIGRAAGAGIEEHFHLHIVPRWQGDANFMPIIGKTDVVSYDIDEIHRLVTDGFVSMKEKE
jgi:ATP adenylyltransferase